MDVMWPWFLLLLLLIPLLIGAYIWILRRRKRYVVRFSSLSLVRAAAPSQAHWRRHLPFALFLLALVALIGALARPVAVIAVPTDQISIILAIDVSRSMCSTDVQPNRLRAAEDAALAFIDRQKSSTQIGIVAFSGFAEEIQPPTTDGEALSAAIESLITGRRTAIGSAILTSLDAIAEIDPGVPPSWDGSEPKPDVTPVPRGAYAPDVIILLTDGVSNTGPLPTEAARQAVDRGVRIYTIGFGTSRGGGFANCDRRLIGGEPFFGGGGQFGGGGGLFGGGGGQFGGGGFRRGIDEATLKQVADMTGGAYYAAESADELHNAFNHLPTYLITKHETTEISFIFVAAAAVLAALALLLALRWRPLP